MAKTGGKPLRYLQYFARFMRGNLPASKASSGYSSLSKDARAEVKRRCTAYNAQITRRG